MSLERVARGGSHDEQVIDVTGIALRERIDDRSGERRPVVSGELTTSFGPMLKPGKLRSQDGRLEFIESRIDPPFLMLIPVDLASVAQALDLLCQGSVVGDHGAAIAQRAEILRRVKAERPGVANGPDRAAVCFGQMGLTAVFDDREVVPRGETLDRGHVRCLPVQVNWK